MSQIVDKRSHPSHIVVAGCEIATCSRLESHIYFHKRSRQINEIRLFVDVDLDGCDTRRQFYHVIVVASSCICEGDVARRMFYKEPVVLKIHPAVVSFYANTYGEW